MLPMVVSMKIFYSEKLAQGGQKKESGRKEASTGSLENLKKNRTVSGAWALSLFCELLKAKQLREERPTVRLLKHLVCCLGEPCTEMWGGRAGKNSRS